MLLLGTILYKHYNTRTQLTLKHEQKDGVRYEVYLVARKWPY